MTQTLHIPVADPSQVAAARRTAGAAAAQAGFDEVGAGNLAIVVTEMATNLVKHAGGGSFLLRVDGGREPVAEVFSIDKGPGIANIPWALQDGSSTAGSPGTGLGAIRRLATAFELYSVPGQGTAAWAQVRGTARPAPLSAATAPRFRTAALRFPLAGETACGDAWACAEHAWGCSILVADGLGHGPLAAAAAERAAEVFRSRREESATQLVEAMHDALRSTRGAAVAVADIDADRGVVRYCGVGNIVGAIASPAGVRRMVSQNGTAGQAAVRGREFTYPWDAGSVLIMHSDGLMSRWDLSLYPGLASRHPALIAAVLYRDFLRGRDDATIVVVRRIDP